MPRRLAVLLLALCASPAAAVEFRLSYDKTAHPGPFTGRVYVMLFKGSVSALRSGPNWFDPNPFFARDVKAWRPGETLVIDQSATGYPVSADRVPKGTYTVQAVMDLAPSSRSCTAAPGNVYGITTKVPIDPKTTGSVSLKLDKVHKPAPFRPTERVKLVDVESKLLTAFYKRPTRLRAGVVLPASYTSQLKRRYPVVYEVPGFGGNHAMAFFRALSNSTSVAGTDVLWVMLDPECHHGHHVFADSANNGPCGKALVEELIPAIEKQFRAIASPGARLLTGHSSGGWSSLWLQVSYPDFFGGVWSTAPDPVDFRDFQRINLYRQGENMFTDKDGKPRPIARRGTKPVLWYKGFSDMEAVLGHGGQLRSFEAVFSEKGPDGQPRPLWDRQTGDIDPDVARSWEKYDIRLVLERNWKSLGPKLAGKLHVYTGNLDTFYLDGATRLLGQSLKKLGSDARVELLAGKDHSSLMDRKMRERIAKEMAAQLRAALE
jgi:S-formylglutathione hydrolase FrmB